MAGDLQPNHESGSSAAAEPVLDEALFRAKLESLAEFAAGAGHEINNPVATIVGRAQMLIAGETDPGRKESLATIVSQALRIRDMIGDCMLFARPPEPKFQTVHLGQTLREAAAGLTDLLVAKQARIAWDTPSEVTIWADPTQASVVAAALLRNAIEAQAEPGGVVTVRIAAVRLAGEPFGRMEIADRGIGLSELEREHLFDPFYSGRQAGRGLGFGLPKCWRILSNHGGTIRVTSNADEGTRCTVDWPAAPAISGG